MAQVKGILVGPVVRGGGWSAWPLEEIPSTTQPLEAAQLPFIICTECVVKVCLRQKMSHRRAGTRSLLYPVPAETGTQQAPGNDGSGPGKMFNWCLCVCVRERGAPGLGFRELGAAVRVLDHKQYG